MAEITVNGKRVVLRDSFPLTTHGNIIKLVRDATIEDLRTVIPVVAATVVEWEFAGDPADPAAYEQMDALAEVWPLFKAVDRHIADSLYGGPKNSAGASSSHSPSTES